MPKDSSYTTEHDTELHQDGPVGTSTGAPTAPRGRKGASSQGGKGRGPGLTKISANLTPRSVIALDIATELSADNQTDVLNRALQVYAYVCKLEKEGKLLFADDPSTGVRERVVLL